MKKLIVIVLGAFAIKAQAQTTASASNATLQSSVARGKTVYTTYCLACHQANGGGVPNLNPPLAKTSFVLGDKKKLVSILLKGMNEEVEIDGNYYSNTMPAQAFLKDQELADVLTYIRNSFGNKATAVTVAEVKAARKTVAAH
ncbi:mono/diheme cytochrome c family protein [Filimonas zeae]|uniref:Cytochrome c n=1 Tax=Filimonas zeae TaxID=1737353 RepID=A0A917MZE2_9BACT|nr:c-type cytochrome [Filimonas zeae]MDR6341611.1 mono/diheme cytochrome c family protein [Filimonas zeae]GGH75031.1 cytochrome c [Filimonas zeae]